MRLHAEHLLQLALDAGGFGMVEAGHFATGGSWIKNQICLNISKVTHFFHSSMSTLVCLFSTSSVKFFSSTAFRSLTIKSGTTGKEFN